MTLLEERMNVKCEYTAQCDGSNRCHHAIPHEYSKEDCEETYCETIDDHVGCKEEPLL